MFHFPIHHFFKYPTELIAFFNHAETGSMKVLSLILLERGEIVLYNVIHITVDLEVLRFLGAKIRSIVWNSAMYKSALVTVTCL